MSGTKTAVGLDSGARTLRAGELSTTFLPARGMLGASLKHRGEELLGRVEDIETFAKSGRTCGIPLLYPWANRLAGTRYEAAGNVVELDATSPLLGHDGAGLPMHGVPWSRLEWRVTAESKNTLRAELDWTTDELLAVFPFPHTAEMAVALGQDYLKIEMMVCAEDSSAVPISFGFHPYLRLPGAGRAEWSLTAPAMRHLAVDEDQIPTGEEMPFAAMDARLGERDFDDGFALEASTATFALEGGGRKIEVQFLEGYSYAQVFAPPDHDYVALEPMTAPGNALVSGRGLRFVEPNETFRAVFQIEVRGGS